MYASPDPSPSSSLPSFITYLTASFKDTMDQYSSNLRSALKSIKEGLKLNVTAAQEEIKQPGAEAARKLPDLPRLPEGDIDKLLTPAKDGAGAGAGGGEGGGGSS